MLKPTQLLLLIIIMGMVLCSSSGLEPFFKQAIAQSKDGKLSAQKRNN